MLGWVLAALVLALIVVQLGAERARADVDDFEFESFSVVYELSVDDDGVSHAQVTERIVARFPEWDQNRGILRAIPRKDGWIPLDVEVLSVTDDRGGPVPWSREDDAEFAVLALGDDRFVHGRQVYVIEYRIANPIRIFSQGEPEEFYWDVNGDGWAQRFGSVRARIELDERLAAAFTGDAQCFAGSGECTIAVVDGGRTILAAEEDLGLYSTLTVGVAFAPGTVAQPDDPSEHWVLTVLPWILATTGAGIVVAAIVARSILWRNPRRRRAIIPIYEGPSEPGFFIQADAIGRTKRAIPASITKLVLDGAARILDADPDGSRRLADKHRYRVEVLDPSLATGDESRVLTKLFSGSPKPGSSVNPGTIDAAASTDLHSLVSGALTRSIAGGYRARPRGSWAKALRALAWINWGALIVPWVWVFSWEIEDGELFVASFVALFAAIVTTIVLQRPFLLTRRGADLRDQLLGVKLYLTVAEEERIRILQSPQGAERRIDPTDGQAVLKLYERLLPWAILWGVEDEWARVLKAKHVEVGEPSTFDDIVSIAVISSSFARVATSSVLPPAGSSSWSGSGGSSFSSGGGGFSGGGGGFSGGGGGGGGGGGR